MPLPDPGCALRVVAAAHGFEVTGVPEVVLGGGGPVPSSDDPHARWKLGAAELEVSTDRYALLPVFYWATADRIVIADRIEAVLDLGAPADLDWEAVGVFLRLGYFLGERTPFGAIRVLPPGARMIWRRGGVSLTRVPPEPREFGGSRAGLVDAFVDTFAAAVRRRLPEQEYVLPLSGGRDSRHILTELVRQKAPPRLCLSGEKFRPDDAGDAAAAAGLAQALGLRHARLDRPASHVRADLVAIRRQNLVTIEGGWALPLAAELSKSTAVTFDGLGGDLLTGRTVRRCLNGRVDFDSGDLPAMAKRLLATSRYDSALDVAGLGRADERLSRATAVRAIAQELTRHADAPSPWTSFLFWNRTRRAIGATPFALFRPGPQVHVPFLDAEVFDLLMGAPLAIDPDGQLHDEVIARIFPAHVSAPYAQTPSGHGAGFVASRSAYVTSALALIRSGRQPPPAVAPRLAARLLRSGLTRPGVRAINRLTPMLVYLMQLEQVQAAAGARPDLG